MTDRTIKPGDKVLIALDVLDITETDGPSNEDGVYLAKGALKLGFANDPTSDLFITAMPELAMPLTGAFRAVAALLHGEPGLAAAVRAMKSDLKYLAGLVGERATMPPTTTGEVRQVIDQLIAALEGTPDGNG